MPSGSANYSQTNGERRVVDNASTFIVGDGSNLKVAKVENTAAAIGTTGSGKLSIDKYVGHNLENVDKLKTVGGSVGISASGITSIGVNYSDKKQEGITKNTVIGNVEIGKSSGDEINRDLDTMTETTEDRDFKTNVNVESQTISYIKNPEKFKEDLQKAKNEIYDIYHAVDSTVNLQGKEDRNISEQVGEVRQAKVIYNLIDSRLQEAENQEDIAKAFEGASEDLGYKVKVIFTDPSNSPQLIGVDENGNTYIKNGTAYVDKKTGIGYILVNTESPANSTKAGVIGTIAEEQSHVIGKKEGRQKVVPDGSQKGLESLGRPTNDYFKKQYSKNDKAIELKSDGKDYSNVDFGEHVGDNPAAATIVILGITTIIGTGRDVYRHYKITDRGIANGIENLKKEENKSRYRKILEEKGKKALLNEMTKEFDGAKNNISELTKLFFVVYGATDEIRNLFIEKRINSNGKAIDMLVLDTVAPEKVKTLWVMPETSENVDKVTNYWKTKLLNRDSFSLTKDNRERDLTKANPDFTRNKEFYSFGNTTLFQSTYGSVTKLENGKYDVDITVMFQYTDRFEDVKNINNSSIAKQGLNKEYEGGKIFSFETNPKIVTIKKQVDSLDEITGLLKNRLKGIDDNSELGKYNIKGVIHD